MNGELTRFAYLRTCTLGMMRFGDLALATIERPWIPNPLGPGGKPRESCVPDGTYRVIPHHSANSPRTYALINHELGVYYQPGDVPRGQSFGRTAILIHVGNYVRDVIGCIAVGMHHAKDQLSVTDSAIAMEMLRTALERGEHRLTIKPFPGTQEIRQ